jgi:hypothetical protein
LHQTNFKRLCGMMFWIQFDKLFWQLHTWLLLGELFVNVEYFRFGNLKTYLSNHRNNFVNLVDAFGNIKSNNEIKEIPYKAIRWHVFEREWKLEK